MRGGLLDWLDAREGRDVLVEEALETFSVDAVRAEVERLAGAFAPLGPGARVAVHARNRAGQVAAVLAARWTGTVLVPINHHLQPPELAWQLTDAGAAAVLCAGSSTGVLGEVRAGFPGVRWWCWDEVPGWDPVPTVALRPPRAPPDEGRPLLQLYTSGTTGRPKGALLTEENVLALVRAWAEHVPLAAGDRVLQVTPLFHVGALTQAASCLGQGATLVLRAEFSPKTTVEDLRTRGITHALLVPAMIRAVALEARAVGAEPFSSLRALLYGAAPLPAALAALAAPVFPCPWFQGYGLTETTGVVTILRPEDHVPERLASAGRPLSCCEVRVVGEDDRPVGAGIVGEVVARGANVALGYHARPADTAEAWRGGWFHTGDAGYLDANGFLFLVDRLKDMILVGGENVYCREVEEALGAHEAVREVAVIGVPHEVWGESVLALVVPAAPPDAGLQRALLRHCRERLARYKCPSEVRFVDALPRNAAGKVRKQALREPFWAGRPRRI